MARVIRLLWVISFLVTMAISSVQAKEGIKIAVLANSGIETAMKKWSATAEYLSQKLGKNVEFVPLPFSEMFPAIEAGQVQFFLGSPSMYVQAHQRYGASAVLTLVNSREGKATNSLGGVIIVSAYNDQINSLADVKGKRFMAVDEGSLGGWQGAWKTFKDAGIDPKSDFAELQFGGKHDNVVLNVVNEIVDAGTVRTDTLERMAGAGVVSMDDIKVLNKLTHPGFPFLCSTALYPEWPMAKLASTPDSLVAEVVAALKELKAEDKAATSAKIVGWSDPLDYSVVEDTIRTLGVE